MLLLASGDRSRDHKCGARLWLRSICGIVVGMVSGGWQAWPRRRRVWVWVCAAALAMVGAALPGLASGAKWSWAAAAAVVVAALAAVSTTLVPDVRAALERADAHDASRRSAMANLDSTGGLKTVGEVTSEGFGARRPRIDVGFLERDKQPEVVRLLAAGRPVLLLGAAMAGKSRLGAQVLRDHYGDRPLIDVVPSQLPAALEQGTPSGAVVWLDELDRYLDAEGLRDDWVQRLHQDGRNVVLATMRSAAWERYQPDGDKPHPQARALRQFELVWLLFDRDEAQRLAGQLQGPVEAAGVARFGLGEYLGGGPELENRYRSGLDSHPRGAAMVRAAAVWRRAGLRAITTERLSASRRCLTIPGIG